MADRLFTKAQAAVEKMGRFVIRNGIDSLPKERGAFGRQEEWTIKVDRVNELETELMLRMARALRIAKHGGAAAGNVTNDPRFDVGWRHFDHVEKELNKAAPRLDAESKALVVSQLRSIRALRKQVGEVHSKVKAVADAVRSTIEQNEKVLLFSHHHATAQELTIGIEPMLPELTIPLGCPAISVWKAAWDEVLAPAKKGEDRLRDTFIDWLCSDLVRSQTWNWVTTALGSKGKLVTAWRATKEEERSYAENV